MKTGEKIPVYFDDSTLGPAELIDKTLIFIYQDLSTLRLVDKIKVGIDLMYYLLTFGAMNEDMRQVAIQNIEEFIDIEKIQKALKDHFETHFLPLIKGEVDKSPEFEYLLKRELDWFVVKDGILVQRVTKSEINGAEEKAILNFRDLMALMIPEAIGIFRECEGCGRYFLPYGKRARYGRRFCNHACNLKFNAKERRKKVKEQNSQEA